MSAETEQIARVVNPLGSQEERQTEESLRPAALQDFVGQRKNISNLSVYIEAAKGRQEALEHVLLYGPPGLGKTTLAMIVAKEMGVAIKTTTGPAIERPADLASILTNLQPYDVLFVDEIHRLRPTIEEVLYGAMEDRALDIVLGKGPAARTMRLDLPPFTVVGATTKAGMLSAPLRSRFGLVLKLDFYEEEEIKQILRRSARILAIKLAAVGEVELAKRSRCTPRIANRLLKRARDFAQVEHDGVITGEVACAVMQRLEIDQLGLDKADRDLLRALAEKFAGGPAGLNTLAACLSEEVETIEEVYEPYLMQLGFINRTPRGRTLTKLAYAHLGLPAPQLL
ncbi:MAG: Holliday junction DNA helicase RuvB [Candidatus Abawacabacteria bacterium RIFCSPHIGHO2_01_FULL_46_8]|uniref:Holliday junction branch migration complex subunit RuvB n=1 Tax=Candidatus Abawacabacteria bacterium RIFCSPHIGHO2_01_FULL_46_8 TaxID=1817815 RepID=A0A1F4XJA9_9BACT|nr:MAG: Holliday junction DNA helicase RuvB [Candidatus Abawacabacteria bacterium RIFCSPHIGHO2_01_FULL_46_8]